jgi:hypothetical protein
MSNSSPRYVRYRKFARVGEVSQSYFRRLLAAFTAKFAATASAASVTATVASNGLTVTGHGRALGDGPFRFTAPTGTLSAVSLTTDFWISAVVDANTIRVSPFFDLRSDLVVSAGVGTATLTRQTSNAAMLDTLRREGLAKMNNTADIDAV